jgi:uncharacterized delta-60 repeat protein
MSFLVCSAMVDPVRAQSSSGSPVASFNSGAGANGPVRAVVYQADGKVIIGGAFDSVQGTPRNRIARLNADGGLDTSFDPGAGADNTVNALLVLDGGQVLVGGDFSAFNGVERRGLALLDADGKLDDFFNPMLTKSIGETNPPGFVTSLTATADRQIIVSGAFDRVADALASGVARLDNRGELDILFQPNAGPNGKVNAIALLLNGQIVIAGDFTTVDNVPRQGIARIKVDGQLDVSFDPGAGVAGGSVLAMALQADGAIVLAGNFTSVGGQPRAGLARILSNGLLDGSFNPSVDGEVRTIVVQDDGRVILGGAFAHVEGADRAALARLNADGSLDAGFDSGTAANGSVNALALKPDNTALIAGDFTAINDSPLGGVGQISTDQQGQTTVIVQADAKTIGRNRRSAASITISRTGDLSQELKVNYVVTGKAVSGLDYAPVKGVKNIKAGKAKGSFQLQWLGAAGNDEQVTAKVKLLPGNGYSIVDPVLVKVKINR